MIRRLCLLCLVMLFTISTVSAEGAGLRAVTAVAPWTLEYVEGYEGVSIGIELSIAHHPISGAAYISFHDGVDNDLKLATEVSPGMGNCGTGSHWFCEIVDSTGNVGRLNSIDVIYVPAMPPESAYTLIGISYTGGTSDLKYAQRKDFASPGAWFIDEVDATTSAVLFTSMKFRADQKPLIAYQAMTSDFTFGSVKLASYHGLGTGNCGDSNNWNCETVDSKSGRPDHGANVSLDLGFDGTPAVAFYNDATNDLELAIKQSGSGCSNPSWTCSLVDGIDSDVGRFASLHAPKDIFDDYQIAYYDVTNDALKYAGSVNSGGNCGASTFDCVAIDIVGSRFDNSYDLSLDVDPQGEPIIAYQDATIPTPTLKVARPSYIHGFGFGNCGAPAYNWQCDTVDVGGGWKIEAFNVAVSFSPLGLATIAYTEYDGSGSTGIYLKVAYQEPFKVQLPLILR